MEPCREMILNVRTDAVAVRFGTYPWLALVESDVGHLVVAAKVVRQKLSCACKESDDTQMQAHITTRQL